MKNLKFKTLVLSTISILFFVETAFTQVPSYVPTNGLVGWWPFNGNANDESGNGNNGTVDGATLTTDRLGNPDHAFSFDGISNKIVIDNENNFDLPQSMTISGWINYNNPSVPNGIIVSKYQNWDDAFNFAVINSKLNLGVAEGPTIWTGFNGNIDIDSNWKHVVTVRDFNSSMVFLYVDGVLDTTGVYVPMIANSQAPLVFGDFYGNSFYPDAPFEGIIDDIAIWNRALSQQEVTALYNSGICFNNLSISPTLNTQNIDGNATFTATTSDPSATYIWQSDLGQGFQTLNNYSNYSGVNTNTLTISNVQLSEHNQQIRAISTSGDCIDTSNVASIQIADTCITNVTVYDTLLTTITDTLIINTTLSLPAPNNENTILIYPNPASDHITIDNGNFTAMAGYSIKIENNSGQQVFESAIDQAQFYVDLSSWTGNGLYFVHLIDPQNNTVTVRKIVLQ
jgi:hypothetical protein